jgi:hypothetical protein
LDIFSFMTKLCTFRRVCSILLFVGKIV